MVLAASLVLVPVKAVSTDLADHWAAEVVTRWQDNNLIKGYPDGTFRPDNQVTRAEFVTMMNNALGFTEEGHANFTDVSTDDWFYKAVSIAAAKGYCSGYEDGSFHPNSTITRQEAAVMIARAMSLEGERSGLSKFTDAADIAGWAEDGIAGVLEAGCMSGYPDGSFAPGRSITRAEAVASLDRVMGELPEKDEEEEEEEEAGGEEQKPDDGGESQKPDDGGESQKPDDGGEDKPGDGGGHGGGIGGDNETEILP